MKKFGYFLGIIFSLFIGCIGTIAVLYNYGLLNKTQTEHIQKTIKEVNFKEEGSITNSIDKIYNAVVVIQTFKDGRSLSTGTGFYYKKDNQYGYIITNHHVIDGSTSIRIIGNNDVEGTAKVLGSDEYLDLAVLRTDVKNVDKVATLGDSSKVNVGDTVFTVGSPLGVKYKGTVTKGILSGKNRQVTVTLSNGNFIMDVLQTDAAINPGNSGGPLLNINGEVIGVTSLKLVEDEIEGMGFALPIESVQSSLDKLEKGEKIDRPLIGIQLSDVDNNIMLERYGLKLEENVSEGVVILKVEENSTASKAGIKAGDIITKINNDKITDTAHFRYTLYKYEVGDTISITYIRDGKENTIQVTLNNKL